MSNWTNWFRTAQSTKGSAVSIAPVERAPSRATGKYEPLYKYLEGRYATIVVLKISEIEDILGFALPAPAWTDLAWWTTADASVPASAYASAWKSARRSAVPNLVARTVMFDRAAS
jgi:hypothetical protein